MLQPLAALAVALLLFSPIVAFPQDERVEIDRSKIPPEAGDAAAFVPPGWTIEEQIAGDLNGDSAPDVALKLIQEDKPVTGDEPPADRQRALVVLFKGADGKLHRAAVAGRLLQCTNCGGAFYGASNAPANVRMEKGVLIVNQDHGSREVTETTYRFRYEPDSKRFALIGFDLRSNDRLDGSTVSESTNYLTGVRVTSRAKGGGKERVTKGRAGKEKAYLEDVDGDTFEAGAVERLGL